MELVNILSPTSKEIVAKKVFFCSNINLVAIKEVKGSVESINNEYSLLFIVTQDSTEDTIFLSCNVLLSEFEIRTLHTYSEYLPNIMNNDKIKQEYLKLADNITSRNTFFTDFTFNSVDYFNFTINSYRREDDRHCTINEIMVPLKEYIKINVLLQNIFKVQVLFPLMDIISKYNILKLITAQELHKGETYYSDSSLYTFYRIREAGLYFDITFEVPCQNIDTKKIINPTSKERYNGNGCVNILNILHVIPYKDNSILILFDGYPKFLGRDRKFRIDKTDDKYGIIIPEHLIPYTNFVNNFNKVLMED